MFEKLDRPGAGAPDGADEDALARGTADEALRSAATSLFGDGFWGREKVNPIPLPLSGEA